MENALLFTLFAVTRFAMHRIYADRINSRGMSRVFCDLCSQKTPRGILPVNSNIICSLKYEFQEETIWKYREEIDIMNTRSFICERNLYGYDK